MKLYTKRGDDGSTDLFGGARVRKDSLRINACGEVDELNAFIGLAISACGHAEIGDVLTKLQSILFEVGADLATPRRADVPDKEHTPRVTPEQAVMIERWIDAACAPLPEMRTFILPGGSELSARVHAARTVCRRAERACVTLAAEEDIGPAVVVFLNRVSDLLFALARRANQIEGVADVPWISPRGRA